MSVTGKKPPFTTITHLTALTVSGCGAEDLSPAGWRKRNAYRCQSGFGGKFAGGGERKVSLQTAEGMGINLKK
jgi:hypothetical protein